MAKIEFNAAWWKKNCAKTLTDSGMEPALKAWEAKKKGNPEAVLDALAALQKAAEVAEKKANKMLHKETIGYLKAYQTECAEFIKKLKKADGSSFTADKILSKPILTQIGLSKMGKMYLGELKYLFVTKGKPSAASKGIYDTFISDKAAEQVNISDAVRLQCDELATAGTWVDPTWEKAHKEIFKLSLTGSNLTGLQKTVLAPLEAEPVLNEIRAA